LLIAISPKKEENIGKIQLNQNLYHSQKPREMGIGKGILNVNQNTNLDWDEI
jgi:hypothetical protein